MARKEVGTPKTAVGSSGLRTYPVPSGKREEGREGERKVEITRKNDSVPEKHTKKTRKK